MVNVPTFKTPYTVKNGKVRFSTYMKMLFVPYCFPEGVNADSIMFKSKGYISCNELVAAMVSGGFFVYKQVGRGKYFKLTPWIEAKVDRILNEAKEIDPSLDISVEGLIKNFLIGQEVFPQSKKKSLPCLGNYTIVPMANWECIRKLDENVRKSREKFSDTDQDES